MKSRDFEIDKSQWLKVQLGDLAEDINERVDNPSESKFDRFVGLEHFVSGDLKIKSWSTTEGLVSAAKQFIKGDILFARRNAYLRRASMVDFDGVCSGDAFVLRENQDKVVPGFLAFIVNSNRLWDYANANAAGTMSKRVKWRDLANYEFLLPPKMQQVRLAELLWAGNQVIEAYDKLSYNLTINKFSNRSTLLFERENLNSIALNASVGNIDLPKNWSVERLSSVAEIRDNLRKPINKETRQRMKGVYPYYGPTGILDYIDEYRLEGEHVLIGEDGDHFLKYNDWQMTQLVSGKFNVNNHAHIIKGSDRCLTEWIHLFFQHRNILSYLKKQGATRYKLTKESLSELPIILPPVGEQREYIERFTKLEQNAEELESVKTNVLNFQKALINQIFS